MTVLEAQVVRIEPGRFTGFSSEGGHDEVVSVNLSSVVTGYYTEVPRLSFHCIPETGMVSYISLKIRIEAKPPVVWCCGCSSKYVTPMARAR